MEQGIKGILFEEMGNIRLFFEEHSKKLGTRKMLQKFQGNMGAQTPWGLIINVVSNTATHMLLDIESQCSVMLKQIHAFFIRN